MFGEGIGYSIFDDAALCVHPKAYPVEVLEVLLAYLFVAGDEREQQHISTASGCTTTMKR